MRKVYGTSHPIFEPCCLATTIGSLPHTDVALGTHLMFESTPEIPAWVQFPNCPRPCATGTALTDSDSKSAQKLASALDYSLHRGGGFHQTVAIGRANAAQKLSFLWINS
jgi:hypothetical protein